MLASAKAPPEILEAANNIVDEVLINAQEEVSRRKEMATSGAPDHNLGGFAGILRHGTRLHNRARGIVTRILTHFRICK